jgi:hypothetical protein
LAISASDIALDFNSVVTGKIIIIMTSATAGISVKLNGSGNTAYTIKPRTRVADSSVVPGFLMLHGDSITSIHLTNLSASAIAEVDFSVLGNNA